jgi:hypothetical protein
MRRGGNDVVVSARRKDDQSSVHPARCCLVPAWQQLSKAVYIRRDLVWFRREGGKAASVGRRGRFGSGEAAPILFQKSTQKLFQKICKILPDKDLQQNHGLL